MKRRAPQPPLPSRPGWWAIKHWNDCQSEARYDGSPWIMLYMSFLTDYEINIMDERDQLTYVKLLLIAGENGGYIKANPGEINYRIRSSKPFEIKNFQRFFEQHESLTRFINESTCFINEDTPARREEIREEEIRLEDKPIMAKSELPDVGRASDQPPKPLKPKKVKQSLDYDADPNFVEFWKAYPKKKAKAEGFKAWLEVGGGNGKATEIVEGCSRCVKERIFNKDPDRIPHPATWLRYHGWLDEKTKENNEGCFIRDEEVMF